MVGFLGFDEATGGQRAQGHEGEQVRGLLRTEDRYRREHEHLPVPGSAGSSLVLLFVSFLSRGCLCCSGLPIVESVEACGSLKFHV